MEELPATGLTKAIGVANLSIKKLEEVLSYARIVPCLNQASVCQALSSCPALLMSAGVDDASMCKAGLISLWPAGCAPARQTMPHSVWHAWPTKESCCTG